MEKFCLKWNEFNSNVNDAFSVYRGGEEFSDVTLAVEGGELIQAHRIILSAISPVFKNIFKTSSHPHPIMYLRGIDHTNFSSIMDFAYLGEASVEQEKVNSFLEVARELQIRGLSVKNEPDKTGFPLGYQSNGEIDFNDDSDQENIDQLNEKKLNVPEVSEDVEMDNFSLEPSLAESTNTCIDEKIQFVSEDNMSKRNSDRYSLIRETVTGGLAQLDDKINALLEKKDEMWKCKACDKTNTSKQMIAQHVEVHIKGVSLPCNICGKTYGSKNSLRKHKSSNHRQ